MSYREHQRNDQILQGYQQWFEEYPFSVFVTLTWDTRGFSGSKVPEWAEDQVTVYLRTLTRLYHVTLGAFGLITLSKEGHLHAHLLLLDKHGTAFQSFGGFDRFMFRILWKRQPGYKKPVDLHCNYYARFYLQAKAEPIHDGNLPSYIAKPKHLIYCKDYVPYQYGKRILERRRFRTVPKSPAEKDRSGPEANVSTSLIINSSDIHSTALAAG